MITLKLYHFFFKIAICKLLLIFLIVPARALTEEPVYEKQIEFEKQSILFKSSDPDVLSHATNENILTVYEDLVFILKLFEEAQSTSVFLKEAVFEFRFQGKTVFENQKISGFTVDALRKGEDKDRFIKRSFTVYDVNYGENGSVVSVSFAEDGDVAQEKSELTHLIVTDRDKYNLPAKMIIVLSVPEKIPEYRKILFRFLNGKIIEFGPRNRFKFPRSIICKEFILDKKGRRVWTQTVERSNRRFNEKGLPVSETTRQTRYSYSEKINKHSRLFDVEFYPAGEIKQYDLIYPEKEQIDKDYKKDNINLFFVWRNGYLLHRLIRKYRFSDGLKSFSSGDSLDFSFDKPTRAVKVVNEVFDIVRGTDGVIAKDRIPQKINYTWNLDFDSRDRVVSRRVLQIKRLSSAPSESVFEGLVFDYLKEVRFIDSAKGPLDGVVIDYYDYLIDGTIDVSRRISIDVVKKNIRGEPVKILLTILSSRDPSGSSEMVLEQDCRYVIDKAVSGDLFYEDSDNKYAAVLESVSSDGSLFKGTLYKKRIEDESISYVPLKKFETSLK